METKAKLMVQKECGKNAVNELNINENNIQVESESSTLGVSGSVSSGSSKASCSGGDSSTDPILQKLAKINGAINKMSFQVLKDQLESYGLNTGGCKDILKKRLKNYQRCQRMALSKSLREGAESQPFQYLVVIDYEATCMEDNHNFVHEIIEFPAVLIDVRTFEVCNVFQQFCKPKVNPQLTSFCTELTGITQAQVDRAKDFKKVYHDFVEWMRSNGLGREQRFAIVTDGPWDMTRFLKTQMGISGLKFPAWGKRWINLRKTFASFYNVGRISLHKMLECLGMEFEGRPHCGLDDSRNIAAIAICLLRDGCIFKHNEHLYEDRRPPPPSLSSSSSHKSPSKPRRKGRFPSAIDVSQEGEDVDDLLVLARLKIS